MKVNARIRTTVLGGGASLLAMVHGLLEIQQGNRATRGIVINAIGGTCPPSCFPAITLMPDFLLAGAATLVVAATMLLWVATRTRNSLGGRGLLIWSTVAFLTGGGFLAMAIGLVDDALDIKSQNGRILS